MRKILLSAVILLAVGSVFAQTKTAGKDTSKAKTTKPGHKAKATKVTTKATPATKNTVKAVPATKK
jgi:hypothetical protein